MKVRPRVRKLEGLRESKSTSEMRRGRAGREENVEPFICVLELEAARAVTPGLEQGEPRADFTALGSCIF
jgi:hypothetical protein